MHSAPTPSFQDKIRIQSNLFPRNKHRRLRPKNVFKIAGNCQPTVFTPLCEKRNAILPLWLLYHLSRYLERPISRRRAPISTLSSAWARGTVAIVSATRTPKKRLRKLACIIDFPSQEHHSGG